MKTQKQFIERASIAADLIRAVVRQCGGWHAFKEMAQDVANHGAAGGFHGFIYHRDTCEFYARNQSAIVDYAKQLADDIGESGAVECVRNFNCLKDSVTEDEIGRTLYGAKRQHDTQVANALAWFALEEVARAYADIAEEN